MKIRVFRNRSSNLLDNEKLIAKNDEDDGWLLVVKKQEALGLSRCISYFCRLKAGCGLAYRKNIA